MFVFLPCSSKVFVYIRVDKYPVSYIQYGFTPIRDSPHPPPPHATPPVLSATGPSMKWGGVGGGNALCVYFHIGYEMLDIRYTYAHIYIERERESKRERENFSFAVAFAFSFAFAFAFAFVFAFYTYIYIYI